MIGRIKAKFEKRLSLVMAGFGYVKVLHKDRFTPSFAEIEILQSLIFEALMVGIDMKNPAKAEHLQDVTRGIIFRIQKLSAMSLSDMIKNRMASIFVDRKITFTLGAGVACFWEVQVKLLAQQIGIEIYEETNREGAKSPSIKDVEPIIKDIKKALPNIEFHFGRLINLRNATVHGNFHQLRTVTSESRNLGIRESFKGNVFMGSFSDPENGMNLSAVTELEKIKSAGLFGWFMDVGNSALFETVIREFQDSIELINAVISIKSLSFEETDYCFEQLCVRGEKLSDQQKDEFFKLRNMLDQPSGSHSIYIKSIEKSLKKNSRASS